MDIAGKVLICCMILILLSLMLAEMGALADQSNRIDQLEKRVIVLETKMDMIYGR